MIPSPAYRYAATVARVIDGDTIVADIDLGLRVGLHGYKVRLLGLNAAEKSTPGGQAAAAHLTGLLPMGTPVVLDTVKDYKYGGEFVARVWLPDGTCLNDRLIADRWAATWSGDGPAPVPPWPRP